MRATTVWCVCSLLVVGCGKRASAPTPSMRGSSTGIRTTQKVGEAGGALASADGRLTLTVPPGALSADVELGVEPITNTAPGGVAGAYRLTPEGTRFAQAATVAIRFSPGDLEGSAPQALRVGYQGADGLWHTLGSSTVDGQVVSVKTTHLSDWSALVGWQLRPPSATVAPAGTVNLTLRYCEPEEFTAVEDELSGLTPRCDLEDELMPLVNVMGWSVNGRPGGSAQDGTLVPDGINATYAAPSAEPMANPVAVQVEFNRRRGTELAVSNIRVGSTGWSGTVSWTLSGSSSATRGMYSDGFTTQGSGTVRVVPAPGGGLKYATGSATWSWQHVEQYDHAYTATGCQHVVTQTRRWTLAGTSGDVANLAGYILEGGPGLQLSFAVPNGPATGRATEVGSETQSGGPTCMSPPSTNRDDPYSGFMPSDILMLSAPTGADPNRLSGSADVTIGDMPPRVYTVSWSLQR